MHNKSIWDENDAFHFYFDLALILWNPHPQDAVVFAV